jgi:MFS superfamily sulfate permease-like transporter
MSCFKSKIKNDSEKETNQQQHINNQVQEEDHDTAASKDRFNVNREVYTHARFTKSHPENVFIGVSLLAMLKHLFIKDCMPSSHCAKRTLFNRVPAIRFVKNYRIKENLFVDILAGINVAIMHIPQGMAYALLATLSPIYGLYTSFYPNLVYWIFGTSRHISIGCVSVVSLMVGSVLTSLESKYVPPVGFNRTFYNTEMRNNATFDYDATLFLNDSPEKARIMIATALAFCIGLIQIVMFVFQLGFLSAFFSEPFNTGFITGCAVHVFTSQIKQIFGIKIGSHVGIFKIPKVNFQLSFFIIMYII